MESAFSAGVIDALGTYYWSAVALRSAGVVTELDVIWLSAALEPLATAVPLGEEEFQGEVDRAIQDIIDDGTWLQLYRETIGEDPPFSIQEMQTAPIPDR